MMRLNLQLTMGTFSLSLFGLIGVAFGMNLESTLEEVRTNAALINDKCFDKCFEKYGFCLSSPPAFRFKLHSLQ